MIDRLEVERSAARGSQGKDIVPPESGPYFIADARQIGRGDGTSANAAIVSVRHVRLVSIWYRPLAENLGRMAAFHYDEWVPRPIPAR